MKVIPLQKWGKEKPYLKDPGSSELGQKIIQHSIVMIDKMGFESFTFRKLAIKIHSTEATIYRYFENKHKLLIYLLSWYWNWLEYRLLTATSNVSDPEERLKIALRVLSEPIEEDHDYQYIDETSLYRIVVAESHKVYLTKDVDKDNKEGLFLSYKRICKYVAAIIEEINPAYRFPTALVSTVVESSYDQRYFAQHLPSLTEVTRDHQRDVTEYLTEMVFKTIRSDKQS